MILIGQYDSSFVRRTAIAMALLGMDFEHRPWSVFGDADRLRELNPLVRVPTLVLDDGEVLLIARPSSTTWKPWSRRKSVCGRRVIRNGAMP